MSDAEVGVIAPFVLDVNGGTDPLEDLSVVIKDGTGAYGVPSLLPVEASETELGPD
jgi:hypothetical protein